VKRGIAIAGLVLATLLVAALALFALAPAELAYRVAGHRLAPLTLDGISGSVWRGRATQWVVQGIALGALEWQLERGPTVAGSAKGEVRAIGDQVSGTARFERVDDGWSLSEVQGRFPAPLLAPALDIPGLALLGNIELDLDTVRIAEGQLATAAGTVTWRGLGVRGIAALMLPGVEMRIQTTGERSLEAQVRDLGGPLAIDGRLNLADGGFTAEVDLVPRENEPRLEEILKFVGERRPDGGSHLRIEGTLKPVIGEQP
jgi:general secretion pathway protein N